MKLSGKLFQQEGDLIPSDISFQKLFEGSCQQCQRRNQHWVWVGYGDEKAVVAWAQVKPDCGQLAFHAEVEGGYDGEILTMRLPNHFKMIPEWVATRTSLTHLNFDSCYRMKSKWTELPTCLQSLTNLTVLDLNRSRQLRDLPEWVGGLTRLRRLGLERCDQLKQSWQQLPSWMRHLQRLETLELEGFTNLKELPDWTGELTNLTSLKLGGCTCLQEHWSSLPSWLQNLSLLKALDLKGYRNVEEIPQFTANFTDLTSLNAASCISLKKIPAEALAGITALKSLTLSDCPQLAFPPPEVCSKGGEETLKFLREKLTHQ